MMYLTEREPHESAREFALRSLKENIIQLKLVPGSLVSEKELAAELGLSRGPVREALIDLARVKIVEVYPQRGCIISKVDYDLVEEARFMRETLETAVVERCCRQIDKKHRDALEENVKLQYFYVEERNLEKLWVLDYDYHRLLFSGAKAIQIHALMNGMLVHLDRVRAMSLAAVKELQYVEDHRLITEAIVSGDSETAINTMRKHIMRYQVQKEAIHAHYPQFIKL